MMAARWLMFGLAAVLGVGACVAWSEPPASVPAASTAVETVPDLDDRWVVSPRTAAAAIAAGATVLDARAPRFARPLVPNAIPVRWSEFTREDYPHQGKLDPDDARLSEKLQALGIDRDRPVVVAGDPLGGWGEDGRVVWMLRALGHEQVALVDGGYAALVERGVEAIAPEVPGDFVVTRRDEWNISRDELQALYRREEVVVLDARSPREYAGATPYKELRGGHVPGAESLHYRELLDAEGRLLPEAAVRSRLETLGITRETPVVAYCTGGVRSAWLTAVLAELDYEVRNYAGSMWEWAAGDSRDYPLVTTD